MSRKIVNVVTVYTKSLEKYQSGSRLDKVGLEKNCIILHTVVYRIFLM